MFFMMIKYQIIYFIVFFLLTLCDVYAQELFEKESPVYINSKTFSELKFKPIKKAPAQVVGLSTSTLDAEISSIIDNISVLPGDKVKKGDVLIELNCDDSHFKLLDLTALKSVTQSNLSLKKYQLSRSTKLYKTKNISELNLKNDQTEVEILKANLNSIQAKIQLAQKNISRCLIKAPFSGVILDRFVNQAEMVSIGQQLIKITDPLKSEVLVQLPIGLVDEFSIQKLIQQSLFVYRNKKYPVTFRSMIPRVQGRARHQQFRFSFDPSTNRPALNAFGELEVILSHSYLPANILVSRKGQLGLFIYKNNTAKFIAFENAIPGRPIKISEINIGEDLTDSTEVIIEGMNALSDGQEVVKSMQK
jgi:RND family efflux transporter MFP subunit